MEKIRESAELRLIKKWYKRIMQGTKPTKSELQFHFRNYSDQAEVLIRRVKYGQSWEDFVMGLDGAPAILRRRLATHDPRPRECLLTDSSAKLAFRIPK